MNLKSGEDMSLLGTRAKLKIETLPFHRWKKGTMELELDIKPCLLVVNRLFQPVKVGSVYLYYYSLSLHHYNLLYKLMNIRFHIILYFNKPSSLMK